MTELNQRPSVRAQIVIAVFAALTFLIGIISPPHLMDDVDATQGEIAKTMLRTGDWVTAHLDGVAYLEKAPLKYWITAGLYGIFGTHDWVARIPNALAVIALCLLVYRFGVWAGSERTGFYAGLVLSTSIGLFLFTRIVIPDVLLTLALALAIWGFLRAIEPDTPDPRPWACLMYVALACGVLLKGLIGLAFPLGICFFYLLAMRQLFSAVIWRRLWLLPGLAVFLAIALPWHVLAILRNPPHFDFTLHADPNFGHKFRGFFWFYFINDQFLRFTNGRWPHDYNTVPRLWFWLYHLIWFFPWSFFLIGLRKRQFARDTRLGRLHLICLIWIALVMLFFSLSTTQEYYSMPIYPALALLIGSAMSTDRRVLHWAAKTAATVTGLAFLACAAILIKSWRFPTPGDISDALSSNPNVYTLALGHMTDLTLTAFAYLRTPLAIAALAFLVGAIALWSSNKTRRYFGTAIMLALFFQAARLALVTFDPYLSSYPIAKALKKLPSGTLVFNGQYYAFSSIPYYTDDEPLLLNGRVNNLEYGSYAPGAPAVFIGDPEFIQLWRQPKRTYLVTYDEDRKRLETIVGASHLYLVMTSGGKQLLANSPVR
jgi:4-amino-4-deoxy-L-arabinose transferase-like glycosyltransferase